MRNVVALLWCWSLIIRASVAAEAPRLNVLFLMADDLRTDLASYGAAVKTPHLDRLARRGVQFNHAYCQQAVCNPSRSSLLTGRRPDTLKIWSNGTHFREMSPDVITLPQWFLQQGYTTRCVGKIFHNWHTKEKGDRRSWSAPEFLHYATHGDDAAEVSGVLAPNVASASPRMYTNVPLYECRDVPDDAYFDGRVASEAVRVLSEVKDQPFFLAVGFWKPHAPFNAPKRYWDLYDRAQLPSVDPSRPSGAPDVAFHDGRELRGLPGNQVTFTSAQVAEIRHGYYANISYFDAQLGRVLDALDQQGLSERTVIVFAGDHGYHLGEHSLWGKTSTFELDARVPLLISLPGAKQGAKTDALAELVDLFPTLVAACGLPTPAGLEGQSLFRVLRDPTERVKPAAFSQHPRPAYYDREPSKVPQAMGYSARTSRVRYTEWRDYASNKIVARELYDAVHDSAETRNQIDAPELAAARTEAEQLLRRNFHLPAP